MSTEEIYNFRKINEKIAIAGQPTEDELRKLKNEGYECVFNLAPIDPRYSLDDEEGLIKSLRMEYLFQPVDFNSPMLDDFYEFGRNLSKVKDKKTLIHCAANYRVSVFFGHYAIQSLGWSQEKCNELIADVWSINDYPVWTEFASILREHAGHTEANISDSNLSKADSIINLFKNYLVLGQDDEFEPTGRDFIHSKLHDFLENNEKIQFILPGFPCKSPNKVGKTFGISPDMGEVLALERLDNLCEDINAIHGAGCELTILCDGTTFSDIVGVPEKEKNDYKSSLRNHTVTNNIKWADLSVFFDRTMSDDMARKQLIKQAGLKSQTLEKFIAKVKRDENLTAIHDKWCSYLYNDVRLEQVSTSNRDEFLQSIGQKAYEMMYRGQALASNIDRTYPKHIRLSVHQYNNSGPKFSVGLSAGTQRSEVPWHNVPLRLKDGSFQYVPRAQIKEDSTALVTCQQKNLFFMEVENKNLPKFSYEIVKAPRFGLVIKDINKIGFQKLPSEFLAQLTSDFGFVVLKDIRFNKKDELVEFCNPYGEIYQWDFGPVHVVKPDEKPDGFVHSIEKVPLHWDLSMLPLTHARVIDNEVFAAKMFMLYCKRPPEKGGGQTTIVDSRMALKIAGSKRVEEWKTTRVTYSTKMTYFGGVPRTFPLVLKHPDKDEYILRYQEGSDSDLQKFVLSSDAIEASELEDIINDVNNIAYDERCMVSYEWEENDLILVDNYYTLHGRLPMTSTTRELWRVQIV